MLYRRTTVGASLRLLCLSAVAVLGITLAIACGSGQQTAQQPTATYAKFTSNTYNFSLEYPASYESRDVPAANRASDSVYGRLWATGEQTSPVIMWVIVLPPDAWSHLQARAVLRSMRKWLSEGKGDPGETNVRLRDSGLASLAGLPAAYWQSSYTFNGATRVEKTYTVLGHDFIYEVRYAAAPEDFAAYRGKFERLASSLKVLPP